MPRRFQSTPDEHREPHEVEVPGVMRFYLIAIGVTILLGLLSGSLWIARNLILLHVLR